jgi:integrase/recombinase XerD
MPPPKHLLQYLQAFFHDHLAAQRGLSEHTVLAYRDALKLFLTFVSKHLRKPMTRLTMNDLQVDSVLAFLDDLEKERKNGVVTRNLRLAALRTFFKYLVAEDPLHAGQYQRVIAIPLKQRSHAPLEYLDVSEMKAVLEAIDRRQSAGCRDYALLNLLYNTGARVQEICDIQVKHLRLTVPAIVTLTGKGRKTRHVPLWQETADLLADYFKGRGISALPDAWVFVNARGEQLSRFGIRHIIRIRMAIAAESCPALKGRRISPHTFRHTTAMHLLQSGVDLAVIRSWLGHVNIVTTQGYVEIDMEMKRKALLTCNPAVTEGKLDQVLHQHMDVLQWLASL